MLNISSLNNIRDQKLINKLEIYKKVLERCHHRIKTASSKGVSTVWFVIPEYLYGVPRYDTLKCAEYIVLKLKKNGFLVFFTYPNLIYIDWNKVPSQLKKSSISNNITNKQVIEKPKFRNINDYKISNNFMQTIKY